MKRKALYFLFTVSVALFALLLSQKPEAPKQISHIRHAPLTEVKKLSKRVRSRGDEALVMGQVSMPNGRPVPGAAIYHQSPRGTWHKLAKPADGRGLFNLHIAESGVHAFYAHEGLWFSFGTIAEITRIVVGGNHRPEIPINLKMKSAVHWTVTVLDEDDRTPLSGAELRLPRLLGHSVFTDHDGQAEFNLPRDLWALQVLSQGYEPYSLQLSYQLEDRAQLGISLKRGVELNGQVVDESGMGLHNTVITLNHKDLSQRVFSDQEGQFTLSSLPLGRKGNLHFQRQGYRSREMNQICWPGSSDPDFQMPPVSMRIVLQEDLLPPTIVKGMVQDMFLRPRPGALISFKPHRESVSYEALADQMGNFSLTLPPLDPDRRYQLLVRASGFAPRLVPFQPEPNKAVEVRPILDLGKAISGLVTDDEGQPIVGALVSAQLDLDGLAFQQPETLTDPLGRFFLPDLSGEVELQTHAAGYLSSGLKIRLNEGEDLHIRLNRLGMLRGFVRDAKTLATISHYRLILLDDQDEAPANKHDPLQGAHLGVTVSHRDGRFLLPAPPPGSHCRLRLEAEGYPSVVIQMESQDPEDSKELAVDISKVGRSLRGHIHRAGMGLADARVTAILREESQDWDFPWDEYYKGVHSRLIVVKAEYTDSAGNYLIQGLPEAGLIDVLVEHEGMSVVLERDVGGEVRDTEMGTGVNGETYVSRSKGWDATVLPMVDEVVINVTINRERFPETMQLQIRGVFQPLISRNILLRPNQDRVRFDELTEGGYVVELLAFNDRGESEQVCSAIVAVADGDIKEMALGFENDFAISGNVQVPGGAEQGDRLFLLPLDRGKRDFRTTVDAQSQFVFQQVPAGDYNLLYLSSDSIYPPDMSSIIEEHSNRIPLRVDGDAQLQLEFRRMSTVSGCVGVNAVDWEFFISGQGLDKTAIYRTTLADKNGCFAIHHLPPGTYIVGARLFGKDIVLVSSLKLAVGGKDLDLGQLFTSEPGRLAIHTSGTRDLSGIYSVSIYPIEQDNSLVNSLASFVAARPAESIFLEDVPPSSVWVKVKLEHQAGVAWPERQQCRIRPNVTSRLEVRLVPVTRLEIRFGPLVSDVSGVRLVHAATGTSVMADLCDELPGQPTNLTMKTCFNDQGLSAHNLKPGTWRVELIYDSGAGQQTEVKLEPGIFNQISF